MTCEPLGALFPDRYVGELIFLVDEGVLIVPRHMGERSIRAMHGYHPDAPHSYASLLTNCSDMPPLTTAIPHVYELMVTRAVQAFRADRGTAQPPGEVPAAA